MYQKYINIGDKMDNIIIFRNLNANDFKKIYLWCQEVFVYTWFEQRKLSFSEIKDKYQRKISEGKQELFIINYNGIDIGLVQIYPFNDSGIFSKNNKKGYEFDIFIGDKNYLSRGIGKIVIHKICELLFQRENIDYIILRPFADNTRAVKCYLKCGFKIIQEYTDKDTIGNIRKICLMLLEKES